MHLCLRITCLSSLRKQTNQAPCRHHVARCDSAAQLKQSESHEKLHNALCQVAADIEHSSGEVNIG